MTASPPLTAELEHLIATLRQDYARFPADQTYTIYDPQVYFRDPTSEFRGVERYRQTIAFIARWFREVNLELHDLQVQPVTASEPDPARSPRPLDRAIVQQIRTDWTLHWTSPLPWSPRIAISGWSELGISDRGLILSHVDNWHCSGWDVVRQHFGKKPTPPTDIHA